MKAVLFNIRVTFIQHPMDLIGRRMAASARDMALSLSTVGDDGGCFKSLSAHLDPVLDMVKSFCTVARMRKFKLVKMIIMGPILALALYTWDIGDYASCSPLGLIFILSFQVLTSMSSNPSTP